MVASTPVLKSKLGGDRLSSLTFIQVKTLGIEHVCMGVSTHHCRREGVNPVPLEL
jgi:hypothetical protein